MVILVVRNTIFFGEGVAGKLRTIVSKEEVATILGYPITNPCDLEVASFANDNDVIY